MASTKPTPPPRFTPDLDAATLVAAYERDGLVMITGALGKEELAAAQVAVCWAFEQPAERYALIRQRTYEYHREHPVFLRLLEHPLPVALAEAVLGDDFHLVAAQCSRNTRAQHYAEGAVRIHQDSVFFPQPEQEASGVEPYRYGFSAMFFMQDTPVEMGPTELIPGSHGDDQFHASADIEPDSLLVADLPAGSLLMFNHRTWHRGAYNRTDRPRDLITNAYARREVRKVQLATPRPDGDAAYRPPEELFGAGSPLLWQLLR